MKVFVVDDWQYHENSSILGVYTSFDKALAAVEDRANYAISIIELDAPALPDDSGEQYVRFRENGKDRIP